MAKPSDFNSYPWSSVSQNSETEQIAQNMMVIMKRDMGDKWTPPTWERYKGIRQEDGGFSMAERALFDKVLPYCKSEDTARLFSPTWAKVK